MYRYSFSYHVLEIKWGKKSSVPRPRQEFLDLTVTSLYVEGRSHVETLKCHAFVFRKAFFRELKSPVKFRKYFLLTDSSKDLCMHFKNSQN